MNTKKLSKEQKGNDANRVLAAVRSCEECKYYVRLDNEGCNYFGEVLNSLEPCKNAVKKNGC